jgi:hypothetical protein
MPSHAEVCVLVGTVATSERAPYLLRALSSVRNQIAVRARPIVIANGEAEDPALLREISQMPGVTLLRRAEGHFPRALAEGRRLVDTPFFTQLDDDDELLPDALHTRVLRMARPDAPDAVVTNAVIERVGTRMSGTLSMTDVAAVERDPLGMLAQVNWMLPGVALFRTDVITCETFEAMPQFLEWTYMGLLLASRHRIVFLAEPTIIHYEGHPFSVDLSRACTLGRPRSFDDVLALDLPARIRRQFRIKRTAAWHQAADAAGAGRAAWTAHMRSLASPAGWRYLSFTRHLLRRSLATCRAGMVTGASTDGT